MHCKATLSNEWMATHKQAPFCPCSVADDNPWNCSPSICQLRVLPLQFDSLRLPVCWTPSAFRGKPILDLMCGKVFFDFCKTLFEEKTFPKADFHEHFRDGVPHCSLFPTFRSFNDAAKTMKLAWVAFIWGCLGGHLPISWFQKEHFGRLDSKHHSLAMSQIVSYRKN